MGARFILQSRKRGHYDRPARALPLAKLGQQVQAAAVGEGDIHEERLEPRCPELAARRRAALGGAYVVAFTHEQPGEMLPEHRLVLDDQNSFHHSQQ